MLTLKEIREIALQAIKEDNDELLAWANQKLDEAEESEE